MEIKIDKNVPLPQKAKNKCLNVIMPFNKMKIGDSFFYKEDGKTNRQLQQKVSNQKIKYIKFTKRKIKLYTSVDKYKKGIRVWRIS